MNTSILSHLRLRCVSRILRSAVHGALILTLVTLPALAQKATVRDGVILRDGEPYARVQTSGSVLSNQDFSFKTLAGQEFMMMYYDDAAREYRVIFMPGQEQARLPARYGSASRMAQEIVDNNLLEGDAFNPAGLKRFMLAHPATGASPRTAQTRKAAPARTPAKEQRSSEAVREIDDELEAAADDVSEAILNIGDAVERAFEKDSIRRAERKTQRAAGSSAPPVERNRAAAVTVRGAGLVQDGTMIGTYKVKGEAKDGVAQRIYSVYSATDGDLVAEVTITDLKPRSAALVTPQDNRTETVELAGRTQPEQIAEIGQWLVKHRYL